MFVIDLYACHAIYVCERERERERESWVDSIGNDYYRHGIEMMKLIERKLAPEKKRKDRKKERDVFELVRSSIEVPLHVSACVWLSIQSKHVCVCVRDGNSTDWSAINRLNTHTDSKIAHYIKKEWTNSCSTIVVWRVWC